uniref:Uncharacterized protein n=1 Tax=Setaria viridis TaxID=4556 RepID=A0A4U6T8A7_SETVI|nr:hypothetical protein SEVIR_9G468000v2 [Setaria viridis]
MAEVPEDPLSQPVGLLEVTLTCPRLSGYAGPAWPQFCYLHVGVGRKLPFSKMLPFEMDEEDVEEAICEGDLKWYVRAQAREAIKQWGLSFRVPVKSGWLGKSLDILVERVDRDLRERSVVVTRGGPHTSTYTAAIGRARVPLLDALVIGDLDEEEEEDEAEDNKKRRRGEAERSSRLEGTLEFGKTVSLMDWELPALRDADGKPRSVVRGLVNVRMCLRRLA